MEEEIEYAEMIRLRREKYLRIKKLRPERDTRLPYNVAVIKLYEDYESMVFNLSEQSKNETIESIKKMTLGQRLKFQDLITKRNLSRKQITDGPQDVQTRSRS